MGDVRWGRLGLRWSAASAAAVAGPTQETEK